MSSLVSAATNHKQNALLATVVAEIRESFRAKWFFLYALIFGGAIILLLALGITESQVLGFTGLSRLLVTYIQLCVAILPIFVLVTTVRTVVGDRESNVLEYILSLPISLAAYYWGKLLARFLIVFLPVFLALSGALFWGAVKGLSIPWTIVGYYSLMLAALAWSFLGTGMFISTLVRKQEWALGLAFLVWLTLLLFIDVILIGVLLQNQIMEEVIIGIALLNPLQAFRTGAILLFDPELSLLGPASYVILDNFGKTGFLLYSIIYPLGLGWGFSWLGFKVFQKGDLV
ncbi:MAG: ABC transporter permease subunit [SAR324 cluster bacterium]|nr:ABC transporter permease subunit [SAR324 cluster bacterium]MBL7035668.1 ABC transporter permease subunit [SAR324 cluster bacterium]